MKNIIYGEGAQSPTARFLAGTLCGFWGGGFLGALSAAIVSGNSPQGRKGYVWSGFVCGFALHMVTAFRYEALQQAVNHGVKTLEVANQEIQATTWGGILLLAVAYIYFSNRNSKMSSQGLGDKAGA
jgi:hypothetical protein